MGSHPVAKRHARSDGISAAGALAPLRRAGRLGWGLDPAATGFVRRPRRGVYVRRSSCHLLRRAPRRLRRAALARGSGVGRAPRVAGRGGASRGDALSAEGKMGPEPREARRPIHVRGAGRGRGPADATKKREGHDVRSWFNPARGPARTDGTGLADVARRPDRRVTPRVVLRSEGTGRALLEAGHDGAATRGTVHRLLACALRANLDGSAGRPRAMRMSTLSFERRPWRHSQHDT
jgi:hypothetical protein